MASYESKILSARYAKPDAHGSLAMPVYHAAAYEFPSAQAMADAFCGRSPAHSYSRISNPTVQQLERRVQQATGALSVTALNTGMAAISHALMNVASAGLNIVASPHVFGNSHSLLGDTLTALGVETRWADFRDVAEVERQMDDNTCAVFFEMITNPQLYVTDLRAISEAAHRHNVPVIADTTIIPFTVFHAPDFGIDIEVISSTKYISGGATSLGGLLIDYGRFDWSRAHVAPPLLRRTKRVGPKMAFTARLKTELVTNLGSLMSPHAAYMQTLGLETLALRFDRQASSALTLARELQHTAGIVSVNYPGLEDNPYHELAVSQFGPLPGAMLTIDAESREAAFHLIDHLQLVRRATNLFDHRSLAIHPASTIFALFSEEERQQMGISQQTIRLSVGLEDPADIAADIRQAIGV
ncbi:MAG: O-acetylhomoserine aminocarboxypropyltransferase/cysteine synthase [Prevotella sp.]|nr:O-acetylhomoserine aminocarboxypropyltransferase/cysteine synthase [Prevotella sp.]